VQAGAWDWLAVAVVAACAVLAALIESLLVPLYAGSVLVPLAPVLAVVTNILLPLLARFAVPRTGAAAAPFAAWLVVVVVLANFPRPEGDVIYPGGHVLQWCSYGTLLGGTAAGAVTLVLISLQGDAARARARRITR
jgi:hypothetical protein